MATKKGGPMLDWLLDIFKVVPNYNFIVTVIAAGNTPISVRSYAACLFDMEEESPDIRMNPN